jgi:hypothetical protein
VATNNKELVGDLPIILSQAIPTALVKYKREDFAATYAIGNTPWLSGASDQNRISRITTTYQKERIDQGTSAGENSLSNWWLRSATSWHHGAGERYYDGEASDLYRYYESDNIDPWTIGELTLLKKTTQLTTAAVCGCPATVEGGTFYLSGGDVYFYNSGTSSSTSTSLSTTATAQKLTTNGSVAIVGASDGIYTVSTSMVVSKIWSKPSSNTTWTVQAINFVKDRIVCGVHLDSGEANTYELSINPSSPPKAVSSSELRYTYPNTSLNYVSVAELNSSILVGYTVGAVSRIHGHSIDETSPLAAIEDPIVVAELPRGETLNQVRSYLNEYVVLATNRGVRIGQQSTDGKGFTYGPLTIQDDIRDVAFDSSYVYATRNHPINANNGLWRINIGQPLDNSYAYAPDLVTGISTTTGVAFVGTTGRKFITTSGGVYIEHPTDYAESGTISSGLIRWGTAENKQPVSIAIRNDSLGGTIGFSVSDQDGNTTSIGSIPLTGSTEFQLSASLQPADHFEITLTLSRSTSDATIAPVVEEWQCRALPAPLRSRTLTIPLLCYEEERDSNGVTRVSNPWERINYLERIEQNGGAVLFQDFSSGEERICTIRAIQFEQTAPPSFASGFGGIVTVQLQTIDTEVPIQ